MATPPVLPHRWHITLPSALAPYRSAFHPNMVAIEHRPWLHPRCSGSLARSARACVRMGRVVLARANQDRGLGEAHGPEVAQADPQALKRIALADVLFDDVPDHARFLAGRQNRRSVHIPLAHLRHDRCVVLDRHIFQMH